MKPLVILTASVVLAACSVPAWAAENSKVKEGTRQVESGAKKIGAGQIGEGVKETAEGIVMDFSLACSKELSADRVRAAVIV
jgi:hypothetical protein